MPSLLENIEALKHTGAEFLIADLETALAFMDVAHASDDEATVSRNHRNAWKAYDTVSQFLGKLALMPNDLQAVENKLAILKARLKAVGLTV